jgi:hypothetical protein
MNNLLYDGCKATTYRGGGVMIDTMTVAATISNVIFQNCVAAKQGGAMGYCLLTSVLPTISYCFFKNNVCTNGLGNDVASHSGAKDYVKVAFFSSSYSLSAEPHFYQCSDGGSLDNCTKGTSMTTFIPAFTRPTIFVDSSKAINIGTGDFEWCGGCGCGCGV